MSEVPEVLLQLVGMDTSTKEPPVLPTHFEPPSLALPIKVCSSVPLLQHWTGESEVDGTC